ncbi:MAG: hypothetical protein JSU01_11635 [Bacteroidetes bacterium]|nr:hypothetical protein [Bacteroidota bacterium]
MKYRIGDYVIKVWLTSVITAPMLVVINALIGGGKITGPGDFNVFLVIILMGAILSLPSMALFYLACRLAIPRIRNTVMLKALLSITGVILTYIPFLIIDDFHPLLNIDLLSKPFFITYALIIITGVWLYKIKPLPPPVVDEPEAIRI